MIKFTELITVRGITTQENTMSDKLPENSVNEALHEAANLLGGWNSLVGQLNRSRDAMRVWSHNNEVPPEKAKEIETLTKGKVHRSRMNHVFL